MALVQPAFDDRAEFVVSCAELAEFLFRMKHQLGDKDVQPFQGLYEIGRASLGKECFD